MLAYQDQAGATYILDLETLKTPDASQAPLFAPLEAKLVG